MRAQRVIDALGDIDPRLLADLTPATVTRRKKRWPVTVGAAAVVALCIYGLSMLPMPALPGDDQAPPQNTQNNEVQVVPPDNQDDGTMPPPESQDPQDQFPQPDRASLDGLFEELTAVGKTTNDTLEDIKAAYPEVLLDYLMSDFMAGGLEGCQLNDGSAGTLKWQTWCSLKGIGDLIENVVETPQGDWLDWSQYAEKLLRLNGVDFFDEETCPATVRYAHLLGLE